MIPAQYAVDCKCKSPAVSCISLETVQPGFVVDDGISGYDEMDEDEDDFDDDDAAELEHRPKKAKVEKQKPAEKKGR